MFVGERTMWSSAGCRYPQSEWRDADGFALPVEGFGRGGGAARAASGFATVFEGADDAWLVLFAGMGQRRRGGRAGDEAGEPGGKSNGQRAFIKLHTVTSSGKCPLALLLFLLPPPSLPMVSDSDNDSDYVPPNDDGKSLEPLAVANG